MIYYHIYCYATLLTYLLTYFFMYTLANSVSVVFYSEYVDTAVRHVMMRQGILGVKVAVMLPNDPKGIVGPKTPLSDVITILEPKEDVRSY